MPVENSSGIIAKGQQFSPEDFFTTKFYQQMLTIAQSNAIVDAGTNAVEVIPHDKLNSLVRTYIPPTSAIEAYVERTPRTTNLNLPDVLVGVTVDFNKSKVNGSSSHPSGTAVAVGSGSVSSNPHATAQASISIIPVVSIEIQQTWGQNMPVMDYVFYIASGSSLAAILAKLSALAGAPVTQWPVFRPVAHTLIGKGGQAEISLTAEAEMNASFTDGAHFGYQFSGGSGTSKSGGVTTQAIRIPPTIHGAITISGATSTDSARAEAVVGVPAFTMELLNPTNNVVVGPVASSPAAATESVTASVSPTSLAATAQTNTIPTSGLRLLDIRPGPSKWGYTLLTATVFDFGSFA